MYYLPFPEPKCLRCQRLTKSTQALKPLSSAEKVHAETQTEELLPPERVKEEFEIEEQSINPKQVIGHIVIAPHSQEESQAFPESASNIDENPGVKQEEAENATNCLVIDSKCRETQQAVLEKVLNGYNFE